MNIVLGTMTFGQQVELAEAAEMVGCFRGAGYRDLDTAYVYNDGKCEEMIGDVLRGGADESGGADELRIATKVNPRVTGRLDAQAVADQFTTSLRRMGVSSADTLYLHFPDPNVPVTETLEACQRLYERGLFKNLGLSNYPAWLVADIVHKCAARGWVGPTVYEGLYNALSRRAEEELFAALRAFNIRFNAYNPLAGGLLTGKYSHFEEQPSDGRFARRQSYKNRYWKRSFFDAVEPIRGLCAQFEIPLAEASFRWLAHHSALSAAGGDGVIVGASNIGQLSKNIASLRGDALPDALVDAFDQAQLICKADAPPYFRFTD